MQDEGPSVGVGVWAAHPLTREEPPTPSTTRGFC